MNNTIFTNIGRFILLILVQVLILNHVNFLGYINPYAYILFILLFPFNANQSLFLICSFLLGLCVDMFGDSGGVHAAASVLTAFARPLILQFTFGLSYEFQTIKLNKVTMGERLVYIILMTVIHHVVLFLFETWSFSLWNITLKKSIFSSIFTVLLCLIIMALFRRKSK